MKDRVPPRLLAPAFDPVPRKPRHDGWTEERQRAFIDALAETGSVKHAAHRINMSPEGAYALRRQPGAEGFRKAWEMALDHGVQTLTDLAIDRAKDGMLVPVYSYGKIVGERRVYNDRLLMFCVKHGLGRIGAADPSPIGRGTKAPETLAREAEAQKEQWFQESQGRLVDVIKREAAALAAMAKALRDYLRKEANLRAAGDLASAKQHASKADRLIRKLGQEPGAWAIDAHMTGLLNAK